MEGIEKRRSIPPMEFQKVFDDAHLRDSLRAIIKDLLKQKKSGIELRTESRIESINRFLEEKIAYFQRISKEQFKKETKPATEVLNLLFREFVL